MREIDKRRSFASPQKRLRAYPGRGSDRKLEKCQNSTNKQNMNIVTLFMLNKKWSVLISNPEDQHVYFLCSRIPETRGRKRWRIPVESQPFCSSPKNLTRRFLGDFNELSIIWGVLRKNQRERKRGKSRIESPIDISRHSTITFNSR